MTLFTQSKNKTMWTHEQENNINVALYPNPPTEHVIIIMNIFGIGWCSE